MALVFIALLGLILLLAIGLFFMFRGPEPDYQDDDSFERKRRRNDNNDGGPIIMG
jgi:hypothetical protein